MAGAANQGAFFHEESLDHSNLGSMYMFSPRAMFLKHSGSVVSVQASCRTLWCSATQSDHLDNSYTRQNHTVACQLIGSRPVSDWKRWATHGCCDATDRKAKGCQLLRTTHPTLEKWEEHLASVQPESWDAMANSTPGKTKGMAIPKEDCQVLVFERVFVKPLPVCSTPSIKGSPFSFIQKVGKVHAAWHIEHLSHTGHMLGFKGYFFRRCYHVVWWLHVDSGCDVLFDLFVHFNGVIQAIFLALAIPKWPTSAQSFLMM